VQEAHRGQSRRDLCLATEHWKTALPHPESDIENSFSLFRTFLRFLLKNEASSTPIKNSASQSTTSFNFQLSECDGQLANN
jgi:hypothetical protein